MIAGPDNNLVQQEKILIQRYYRLRKDPDRWRKPPKDGGISERERRRFYAKCVARARKEFLAEHPGEIWKRHCEVGFVLKCDGSEDGLI